VVTKKLTLYVVLLYFICGEIATDAKKTQKIDCMLHGSIAND